VLERALLRLNRLKPILSKKETSLKRNLNYFESLRDRDDGVDLSRPVAPDCPYDREVGLAYFSQDKGMFPRALGPPKKPSVVCLTRDSAVGVALKGSIDECLPLPGVPERHAATWAARPSKMVQRLRSKPEHSSYSNDRFWPMYAERTWIQYLHETWRFEDALAQLIRFCKHNGGPKTSVCRKLLKKILFTVDLEWGYKAPSRVKAGVGTLKGFYSPVVRLLSH
jgi:hypothetical protein